MSSTIRGITFENQVVTAKNDGLLNVSTFSDGILSGCGVHVDWTTHRITIDPGFLIACGRVMQLQTNAELIYPEFPSGENNWVIVKLSIDTSRESSVELFNQAYFTVMTGTGAYTRNDGRYSRDNINDPNVISGIYEMEVVGLNIPASGTGSPSIAYTVGQSTKPADIETVKADIETVRSAASAAQTTANNAMPKSGGTFTGGVIANDVGRSGGFIRNIVVQNNGGAAVSSVYIKMRRDS